MAERIPIDGIPQNALYMQNSKENEMEIETIWIVLFQ